MDPKIKNWLGIAAIAALVIVTLGSFRFVGIYADSAMPRASFATTGEGKVNVVPDIAEFSFGVTTEGGKDVAALQAENTEKANAAIDYVKSQGVDSKDIRTESYNISPRYQSFSCNPVYTEPGVLGSAAGRSAVAACPPSQIVGYTIYQTVHVKIRDFKKTGDILSGVASRGVNNVSGLNFSVDDIEGVKNDARAEAIKNAREKAAAVAKSGGFRIGRILSIQESGYNPPMPYYSKELSLQAGSADAAAPSIEPGSQDATVNITVTYEIR